MVKKRRRTRHERIRFEKRSPGRPEGQLGKGPGHCPAGHPAGRRPSYWFSSGYSASSSATENISNTFYSMPNGAQMAVLGILGATLLVTSLYSLAVFIIGAAVDLGFKQFNISLLRREEPNGPGVLFSKFHIFGKALLLRILMSLFIFLWSLLLIVPGIIAAYRYAMAPYLMTQNPGMSPTEAINASKEMMKGHKGRLFCLNISFIGWMLLAVLSCGIGFLWLNPYMYAAEAAFYLQLTGQLAPAPAAQYQQG